MSKETATGQSQQEGGLTAERRRKLELLQQAGFNYPNSFRRNIRVAELRDRHGHRSQEELSELPDQISICGRMVLQRIMGKASFLTLQDGSGRIQCYLSRQDMADSDYDAFTRLDLGDLLGVHGSMMRTRKGELTVRVRELRLLVKCLRPLPDKHHGLQDVQTRYRQRYLDLMMNEESRQRFRTRSRIIAFIRDYLVDRAYLEVETPMMQAIPSGAMATPFVTHYKSLDTDMYLRVAPELNLKRLLVGGYERVFEINRNFRNEGISTIHSPEFTMLEFYEAYADYEDLMQMTEAMLRELTQEILGSTAFEFQGEQLDFDPPIPRLTLLEAIVRFNPELDIPSLQELASARTILSHAGVQPQAHWGLGKLQMEIFEATTEGLIRQPLFVTQYPAEVSPLARSSDADPFVTDRFELFVMGRELANGFSELNDPAVQAQRLLHQLEQKALGETEAMGYDSDYVRALEYGMPPAAGEGLGIDRLVMLLTDSPSIRDVVLFPHLRPEPADPASGQRASRSVEQ